MIDFVDAHTAFIVLRRNFLLIRVRFLVLLILKGVGTDYITFSKFRTIF